MACIDNLDNVDELKRKARLDQLEAAEVRRKQEWGRRKQDQTTAADPDEDVATFLSTWDDSKKLVQQHMRDFCVGGVAREQGERGQVKSHADTIVHELFDLDRSISGAAYFLPAFEIRNLTATVDTLRAELQSARGKRLPRVPFAFSDPDSLVLVDDPLQQGLKPRTAVAQSACAPQIYDDAPPAIARDDATTISSRQCESIHLSSTDLQGRDWMLSDLQDCTVLLHGPMQALHLHRLQRCHIQGGPVGGATFGEQLSDCTLMLATHQLRLHHVTGTDAYVWPGSDPIIEDCSNVGFAPLPNLPFDSFLTELADAGLPSSSSESAWRRVQDFQYPGHESSPNWHIINANAQHMPMHALDGAE